MLIIHKPPQDAGFKACKTMAKAKEEAGILLLPHEEIRQMHLLSEDYLILTSKRILLIDKIIGSNQRSIVTIPYSKIESLCLAKSHLSVFSPEVEINVGSSYFNFKLRTADDAIDFYRKLSSLILAQGDRLSFIFYPEIVKYYFSLTHGVIFKSFDFFSPRFFSICTGKTPINPKKIKMKAFENKNLVIERDEQLKCLIQNWKGFASSERFREGILKTVELFKDKKLNKILSNTKDFGIVKKEDTDWVSTNAMPLLVQNGLKYMAFVLPTSAFSQMSVENFKKESAGPVEIRYFDNLELAKKWMAEAS